jgi:hypothetical protein
MPSIQKFDFEFTEQFATLPDVQRTKSRSVAKIFAQGF